MRRFKRHSVPGAPVSAEWVFRTGVHESLWTATPSIPLTACPTAAVRVMTQDQGEITQRGNRCKKLWNDGVWSFPCLRTHWTTETSGPSSLAAQGGVESPTRQFYRSKVAQLINLMDTPVAALPGVPVLRGEIFEVANEPRNNTDPAVRPQGWGGSIDQALRALAGSYDLIRASGRKVVFGHMLAGGYGYAMNRLDNPVAVTGHADFSMIDGWAWHVYSSSASYIATNSLTNLRNRLDASGQQEMPIYITENGFPEDRYARWTNKGPFDTVNTTAQDQADYLQAFWDLLSANSFQRVRDKRIHLWTWFAYADYNPGQGNWDGHCGLVEQDTRLTATPNHQTQPTPTNPSWVPHPVPYDGRAKGAGVPGPPGPNGLALRAMKDLPKETLILA